MNTLLNWCAAVAIGHPRRLLVIAALVTVPLLLVAASLEISTSRTALVSEANPHWQRYMAFAREFGIPEDLVVVVDGPDAEMVHRFMDAAAERIVATPGVAQSVFHRIDLSVFEQRGLLYVDDADLDRLEKLAGLDETRRLIGASSAGTTLNALAGVLQAAPGLVGPDAGPRQTELMALTLERLVDAMQTYAFEGRTGPLSLLDRSSAMSAAIDGRGARGGIDAEGYFTVRDGKTGVLFVRPRYTRDEMQVVLPFVAAVRTACEAVVKTTPGVTFGLTGIPATQEDEFFAIQRDTVLTGVVALVGVAAVFLLFLPTIRLLLYALVPVAFGVVWTAAAIRLMYGYVNFMSSVFLVVLIGMGIDFSVHISARYLEGRRRGLDSNEAVRQAVLRSGRGVMTGAVTSAGAFIAVGWCGFQGIEQLGVAAGVGLILTLAAALTVFPATLALAGPRIPIRAPRVVMGLGPWASYLSRQPAPTAVLILGLTVPMAYAAWYTPFDFSLVDLLPRNAESARLMARMLEERELSANAAVVAAPSLHEARVVAAELRNKPSVFSVLDAGLFIPENQDARLARLAGLSTALARPPDPASAVAVGEGLSAFEEQLEALTDVALQQGQKSAARVLGDALDKLLDISDRIDEASVSEGLERFARAVTKAAQDARDRVRSSVENGAVTPETLPAPLKDRFISTSGRYAVYAVPKHSMWDRAALGTFIEEVRSVAPDATGFPETFYENTGLIQRGFLRAALYAGIAVVVLLSIDLRRRRDVMLAVVPVVLGVVWMVGSMRGVGVPYNLANIVGLPLIIGVGIDNGVHLMHRFRESGSMVESLTHTGTAVALSSLTTMVGFGALALSSHRGLASMGLMMLMGVGACLLMALTVLPAALAMASRSFAPR